MKISIMMKADDFRFPSSLERKEIEKDYPRIEVFDFEHMKEVESIIHGLPLDQISRTSHLFQWNTALQNRFGKLHETYVYMMTYYNRQFAKDISSTSESERAANGFLFEYYAEIFYYFFFSSREIVGQIIRVYYRVDALEDSFYFDNNKNFINEVKKYPLVEEALATFKTSVAFSSKIRNKFTHKFTPTQKDYRPTYKENDGVKSLELGRGDTAISLEKIVDDTKDLLIILKTLMDTLIKEIK